MSRHAVLFVIGQAGSAAFFAPLWKRWSESGRWRWHLLLRQNVGSEGLLPAGVSPLPVAWEQVDEATLDGVAEDGAPELVVVSSTYQAAERQALLWARRRGITTLQLVDSYYDYAKRVRLTNGPGLMPDHLLVNDSQALEDAVADGLPRDRLNGFGNPAWEHVVALPPADERVALFVGQPVGEDMAEILGYDQHAALALLLEAKLRHPERIGRVVYASHPREKIDPSASGIEITTSAAGAMRDAGVVFGMFSSLLIDAALAGRRTISLQPGHSDSDYCELSRRGLIPKVETVEDLIAALDEERSDIDAFRRSLGGSSDRLESWFDSLVAEPAA